MIASALISILILAPWIVKADSGQWVNYSGNPVLSPTPDSWDGDYMVSPRVLYDQTTGAYRMWYNGANRTGTSGIGYASSMNGVTWAKYTGRVLTSGPSGSWDSAVVQLGAVIWNGTSFLMWYRGSNVTTNDKGAVGLATSNDGLSWTKYRGNPVMQTTQIDQGYIASPFVVRETNTYNMWYAGRNATYPSGSPFTNLYYATSFDGIHWSKSPSAVLTPSTGLNAWDSGTVFSPSIYFNGTSFALAYTGLNQSLITPRIGFSTSPDGTTWIRYLMNPIVVPGPANSWDSAGVEQPDLVLGGGGAFMLYYDGFSKSGAYGIGFARPPQGFLVPEFPLVMFPFLALGVVAIAAIYFRYNRPE